MENQKVISFNHIEDCWNAIENCDSFSEIEILFKQFPQGFGEWDIMLENNYWVVENTYRENGELQFDCREIDNIVAPDIVLEAFELVALDSKTEDIEVSKIVFDDFDKDAYIKILFCDSEDGIVWLYKMVEETEDTIKMEYMGIARLGD